MSNLSKSNKIFFAICSLPAALVLQRNGISAYSLGRTSGQIFAFLIFPSLFFWAGWRLSKKNRKVGIWAFNIVLTLLFFSFINNTVDDIKKTRKLNNMQNDMISLTTDLQKDLSIVKDDNKRAALAKTYQNSVINKLNEFIKTTKGDEKKAYTVFVGFLIDEFKIQKLWEKAFASLQSPTMFDFSLLNTEKEFKSRLKIASHYIKLSLENKRRIESGGLELQRRFDTLGGYNRYAKGMLSGFKSSLKKTKPVSVKMMQTHANVGKITIRLIKLLQTNIKKWSFINETVEFTDEEFKLKYNNLIKEYDESMEKINLLRKKILNIKVV
jgi:hypothetical protein